MDGKFLQLYEAVKWTAEERVSFQIFGNDSKEKDRRQD